MSAAAEYARSVTLVLAWARAEARAGHADEIVPDHLLVGLGTLCRSDLGEILTRAGFDPLDRAEIAAEAGRVRACFDRAGVHPRPLRRALREALATKTGGGEAAERTPHRGQAAWAAFRRAARLAGERPVDAADLLEAVLETLTPVGREVLASCGVPDPVAAFILPRQRGVLPAVDGEPADGPADAPAVGDDAGLAADAPGRTPLLDRFGRDLTALARAGKLPPLVGRRAELRSLAQVLVRQRKANAVLVGHPGTGKTGIVEGLAQRLVGPGAPAGLAGARIVELSMGALVAGTSHRGEFEERLQQVLAEATGSPEVIVFVDELHTVLGAGGRGASDAANLLKPALARGELRCIGATTPGEYRRDIEGDPALARRFEVVWVEEPTRQEAVEILMELRGKLAGHHDVQIDADACEAAVELAIRHLPEQRLPDKAIDVLDQACAAARIRTLSPEDRTPRPGTVVIGRDEVAEVVARRARVPLPQVAGNEAERLLGMEEELRRRVIGQDAAVRAVAEAVRTGRSGLGDPRRPVGVFLFAGPTGTGKTELAKALAQFLFGDEGRLVRVDLSEYKERHSISRLLGAPPGYLGHDREGQLSGPLRDHPHSVVLFDEIEKAHPEVLDLLLQICDEGQLTDSRGRRVPFQESVVILTTNLGAGDGPEPRRLGFSPLQPAQAQAAAPPGQPDRERITAALRQTLRPELLGRIGQVVVFEPLDDVALGRVLDKLLAQVEDRLRERSLRLEVAGSARRLLLRRGSDARAGARALEHAVEHLLVQPLGRALLAGEFADGDTVFVEGVEELVLSRYPLGMS